MSSDLNAALSALKKSSKDLNQLTDRATDAVKRVEDLLDGFSIGLPIAVTFGGPEPRKDGYPLKGLSSTAVRASRLFPDLSANIRHERRSLEYRKVGKDKAFRIVVRDYDNELLFWDSLSRELKLEAVTALPALVQRMHTEVQSRVREAETALEQIDQFIPSASAREEL